MSVGFRFGLRRLLLGSMATFGAALGAMVIGMKHGTWLL